MNIIVTGAAGGLGIECVKHLANNTGVKVLAISRSEEALERIRNQFNVEVFRSDFTDVGFQNEIAEFVKQKFGLVDVLINNAGVLVNKPFTEINRGDLEFQMKVNYEAPFLLIQSLLPYIKKSEVAHIVNIGSMGGFQGSSKFPGLSAYSASKGAIAILSECLAEELKGEVKVNCLALGSADTEMLRTAFPGYKSEMSAENMAAHIVDFALNGHKYYNGKILPVAGLST